MSKDEESVKRVWGNLVARSWKDGQLRARLLEEPAAVLKEHGVAFPDGATIKTFEDDGNTIVLPVAYDPAERPLSDEVLGSVAGGLSSYDYGTKLKSFKSFSSLSMDGSKDSLGWFDAEHA